MLTSSIEYSDVDGDASVHEKSGSCGTGFGRDLRRSDDAMVPEVRLDVAAAA
jgi:hypothetical protein